MILLPADNPDHAEGEHRETHKEKHYELVRQRIILPRLEGAKPPVLRQLAASLGLPRSPRGRRDPGRTANDNRP
jgi:hypothetical protein